VQTKIDGPEIECLEVNCLGQWEATFDVFHMMFRLFDHDLLTADYGLNGERVGGCVDAGFLNGRQR
jgi:hypothetical protein